MGQLLIFLYFIVCSTGMRIESEGLHGISQLRQWYAWKAFHGKEYESDAEEQARIEIWAENMQKIMTHNLEGHSYNLAMNGFGDLASSEYRDRFLKARTKTGAQFQPAYSHRNKPVPKEVDWRKAGVVTPVKNQGALGASWAYSATGSLEGQHAIKNGTLVPLSDRNLVDCCNCQSVSGAFTYVMENHGIDTAAGYPTQGPVGVCHYDPKHIGATCTGYRVLPRGSEWDLQVAIANVGPISAYIDASHSSFQLYSSGVYDEPACSSTPVLDHTVLIVGYGTYSGQDYWLVKNSWGREWGMDGYIKMSRNKNNQCGIASNALYPLV